MRPGNSDGSNPSPLVTYDATKANALKAISSLYAPPGEFFPGGKHQPPTGSNQSPNQPSNVVPKQ